MVYREGSPRLWVMGEEEEEEEMEGGGERENVHLSETKQNFCIDLILRVGMWSLGSTSIEFIFSPWF